MKDKFKRLTERPKLVLDVKGLLINSWHSGKDPDAIPLPEGKYLNTAGYAIQVMLDKFLLPAMNNTFFPLDVIAVWDGGNDYRKRLFPGYKAKRSKEKDATLPRVKQELEMMEGVCKRLLANLGAINMTVPGVEGDDIIAMVCERLACRKVVYTIDSDLLQLTSPTTTVLLKDTACFGDELDGLKFRHMALRKSIVGDTSDEYPGIRGLGDAAWKVIYEKYGHEGADTLVEIVENQDWAQLAEAVADNPNCKYLAAIQAAKVDWEVQYRLAKQHPDLCWGFSGRKKIAPEYYTRPPDRAKCYDLLLKAGIPHMMGRLEDYFGVQTLMTAANRESLQARMAADITESPILAFDYETWDTLKHPGFLDALPAQSRGRGYVDVLSQAICGASFCYGNNLQHCIYIPAEHKDTDNLLGVIDATLKSAIAANKPIAAHNASFEEQVTKQCLGLHFDGMIDTAVTESYAAEESEVGLKDLTKTLLGMSQTSYKELLEAYGAEDMRGITGEQVLQYGLDDSIGTAHLWKLRDLCMQLEGTADFYYENETLVTHVLSDSFESGVKIDYTRMDELRAEDEVVATDGRARIIQLLMENCTEESEAAADAFLDADYDYVTTKLKVKAEEKKWGRDKVKAEREVIRLNYIGASVYRPITSTVEPINPTGTLGEVKRVAESLGLPPVDKLTSSGVTDWLMAVGTAGEQESLDFCNLLAKSIKNLNKYRKVLKTSKEAADAAFPTCAAFIELLRVVLQRDVKPKIEGDELNFGSPKQMQELFYLKLRLPVRERTKKQRGSFRDMNGLPGSPATDDDAVEAAKLYDCPEGDWRRELLDTYTAVKEAVTRDSLYYKPYPHWAHPRDGVIHPGIINCGTATRRPTGTSPNVLQISKGKVRTCIVPRYAGHVIITADFSGQELRLTASESLDPVMIEAYTGGGIYTDEYGMDHPVTRDIHSVTACAFAARVVRNLVGAEAEELLLKDPGGFVNYDFYRQVLKHESDNVISGFGKWTEKVVYAFNLARKMAKVVNFLIIYGGNHRTLAKKLGIPEEFAQMLMDLVFASYARLAPWQKEVIDRALDQGYVTTAYGIWKHVSADLKSADGGLRSRAERQTVNHTIQGCLQAGALVDTDRGLLPIERLVGETFKVNTGVGWSTAVGLRMGRSQAARLTLSSGLTVECDVRHKVKSETLEWRGVVDLKPGDWVALPQVDSQFNPSEYEVNWPFVVGAWLGDGSLSTRKGSRPSDTHFRSTFRLVGGVVKKGMLQEVYNFLRSEGVPALWKAVKRRDRAPLYIIEVNQKSGISTLRDYGVCESTALEKRVPEWVMRGSSEVRTAFISGFLLTDGSRRIAYRVHTPNQMLLRDLQILAAAEGVDSSKKTTAYGHYVEFRQSGKNNRQFPFSVLSEALDSPPGTKKGDCESIAERRAFLRGSVTQKLAERMLAKHTDIKEVYRYDRVVSVELEPREVETFTLSVDHPLHQYVADGVIHKNCAAEILKVVLRSAYEDNLFQDTGARMIAPVYDEISSSVPIQNAVEYCVRLQKVMNITPPGHVVPMMAEICVGKNWGKVSELGDNPAAQLIEMAIEKAFAA